MKVFLFCILAVITQALTIYELHPRSEGLSRRGNKLTSSSSRSRASTDNRNSGRALSPSSAREEPQPSASTQIPPDTLSRSRNQGQDHNHGQRSQASGQVGRDDAPRAMSPSPPSRRPSGQGFRANSPDARTFMRVKAAGLANITIRKPSGTLNTALGSFTRRRARASGPASFDETYSSSGKMSASVEPETSQSTGTITLQGHRAEVGASATKTKSSATLTDMSPGSARIKNVERGELKTMKGSHLESHVDGIGHVVGSVSPE